MPVLPGAQSLGQPNIEESSRPGASIQTDALGSGMQAFGAGLKSFGKDMFAIAAKKQGEQEAIGGANADAYVAQKLYERQKEIRDNPNNFEAYGKENPEFLRKITAEAQGLVPETQRAKWLAGRNLRNQGSLSELETQVRGIHRDRFIAQTQEQIDNNRRIVIDPNTSPEKANEIINLTRKQFDEAVSLGFMTKQQAEENGRKWREGTALQWLQTREPDQRMKALGSGLTGTDVDMAMQILRQREGFRTGTYWDVNHHRLGYGSDTITDSDGTVRTVRQGDIVTREDAERDLKRRTGLSMVQVRDAIGKEAFDKLSPQARAAMASVAYNYGRVPENIAQAGKSGDPEAVAAAIEARAGDNGGVNRSRRQYEASIARGSTQATGIAAVLDPLQQQRLRESTWSEIDRRNQASRTEVQREVQDDIVAIETTGAGNNNLTYERVAEALGREAADNWQMTRGRAARVHEAFNGIEGASNDEIDKRIEALRPVTNNEINPKTQPGAKDPSDSDTPNVSAGFAEDMKAYLQAQQRAQRIKELRLADPAQSVMNDPGVAEAERNKKVLERPDGSKYVDPKSAQALMAARWQAQGKLGISEEDRMVMSKKETAMLARRLREIGVDDPGALNTFTSGLRETFGEWADEVLASVIRHNNVATELSKMASDMIMKVGETGAMPSPNKMNDYEIAQERVRLGTLLSAGRATNPQQERIKELDRQNSMRRDDATRQAKGLYDNEVQAIQQERARQEASFRQRGMSGEPQQSPSPKIPGDKNVAQAVTRLAEENAPKSKSAKPDAPDRIDPAELELFLTSRDPDIRRRFRAKYGNDLSDKLMARWLKANGVGNGPKN